MAEKKQSWLDVPTLAAEGADGSISRWPGEHLGLPESGPGALASVLRRTMGLWLDWTMCGLAAYIITAITPVFGAVSTVTMLVFFLSSIVSVSIFARTPGQALCGIGVARLDSPGQRVGVGRAVARALLTVLIFPPVLVDSDGRGLHDRATGTAVIFG